MAIIGREISLAALTLREARVEFERQRNSRGLKAE
jgi:hypothetical protein